MSRIGKQPVAIPAGVKVKLEGKTLTVEGAKAKLVQTFHEKINIKVDDAAKQIIVTRNDDERLSRSLHGLTRSLIANMIHGVTKGFETKLKIVGLGYQARMDQKTIVLSVGYSNQIRLTPPEGVTVEVTDKEGTAISVKGADKQAVGQFAAEIRASRKPEPYKGKGIRYEGEVVRQKEGKTFASGG
ncbi:MAG: 50S ribosomal protein L6 [Gemmataceae bacterium]|jgi:large subunit ribosomal protein L6|nr:50S ribosomal protein L6 [Gemmataceae bacterium]